MFDFEKCRFDDAEISRVAAIGDELHVAYLDWREQELALNNQAQHSDENFAISSAIASFEGLPSHLIVQNS